jgi:hypothetical protein
MINIDIDHFRARVLQDCLSQALPMTWLDRARAFKDAAPRPGDYHGEATQEELRDRFNRCRATARACHAHARLLFDGMPEEISADVLAVLQEVDQ